VQLNAVRYSFFGRELELDQAHDSGGKSALAAPFSAIEFSLRL
jgi:hypothetical protein